MVLIYDTETTGLPRDWNAPLSDGDNWPRLVQLAWQLHDENGKLISRGNQIVQPDGFTIPYNSTKIHGISTERAQDEGMPLGDVVKEFMADAAKAKYVMGHNIGFDVNVVGAELLRRRRVHGLEERHRDRRLKSALCTRRSRKSVSFRPTTKILRHQNLRARAQVGRSLQRACVRRSGGQLVLRCWLRDGVRRGRPWPERCHHRIRGRAVQRLLRFVRAVGHPSRVIAATDCGFDAEAVAQPRSDGFGADGLSRYVLR